MDRDDSSQTGEMDVQPLEGTGHPLSCGHRRGGVRLFCRHHAAGTYLVAGTFLGVALPAYQGTETDVEAIYHREYTLSV